ncbi:CheR family methyltransferase [Deinococcus sp. QL22]|uniref:CheR family methyltransferase n=1 Tax=Deinococcus sp. QL22 TaxID=2939437 RepID=UPI002017F5A7|nr:CheR family methyltransferase [Deinococcus sp. QL22]UQN10759.1 PAS domain-containing protein [Deinococcus sp. QL22]UQN10805.1 PAS domain-containing protein [Deinococcus sp. QL22]
MSDEQPPSEAPASLSEPQTPSGARPSSIVGIGGSAGALDGYERFFLSLPAKSGMAFVVVPHLDPQHQGLMPHILQRCTSMPVIQIQDGMAAQPDQVYVIPPGHSLTLMNSVLLLDDLERAKGKVIDHFFESLAVDQGERAVGIILSGMGSDGTHGVQVIREHFGLVMVQDPQTAEYPAMPRSAAETQLTSEVLPAEELAPRLYTLVTQKATLRPEDMSAADGQAGVPLQKILRLIRASTGQDFTRYKRSTLVRRIDRRMKNHQIEGISQYVQLLQDAPEEVQALFQDFTINVTSFFRDVDAFDKLKAHLRNYIPSHKRDLDNLRVWVAGCSTGEEAYSVAIVLHELMEELKEELGFRVQIFATDIDLEALEKARSGVYPREIEYVISPERLQRAFEQFEDGYQVRPEIRSLVTFALHNTFGDPPFTRLDLLCCRNMLIYISGELQTEIMSVFHFALRPEGLLFLGTSETAGQDRDRFSVLDQRWKIYGRGEGAPTPLPVGQFFSPTNLALPIARGVPSAARPTKTGDLAQFAQDLLLAHHAPPAVLVNESGDILFVHGPTARYLELPGGTAPINVFEMGRGSLRYELPAAVRQAITERREVRRTDLPVEVEGTLRAVDITVRAVQGRIPALVMIEFHERGDGRTLQVMPEQMDPFLSLQRELQYSKETLQATVEERGVSLEELRTTNEELQTTNEELQSTNEELTTSKEELQSLNEELTTINAEHHRVIHDLAQVNDDLKNLLDSAGIATVFLDNNLRIKRFTPRISQVINLMPVDVGRLISDITVNLNYDALTQNITQVLDTLEGFETQVQSKSGQWYLMRISPYRTSDHFIDGVVVAFTNIDLMRALEQRMQDTAAYVERILNSIHDPLLVLDDQLRVLSVNRASLNLFKTPERHLIGEYLYNVGNSLLDTVELMALLQDVIVTEQPITQRVIDVQVPHLGPRQMKVEVDPLVNGDSVSVLLKLEDVTDLLRRADLESENLMGDAPDLGSTS